MLARTAGQSHYPYIVLSAPRQVAMAIKREILEGALRPGDHLPSENELAGLFGVSRPTIRAGLQELCAAHILNVRRGRGGGYRVAQLSLENLEASVTEFISLSLVVETLGREQFLEVRRALELLSAETAARRRTSQALAQLEDVLVRLQEMGSDSRRAFELDLDFHRLLAGCTENPLLESFEGAMIAVLHHFFGDGALVAPAMALANVEEIIFCVRASDAEAAKRAMSEHLAHSAHYFELVPES